jgi:hypothetical protein
VDEDAEDDEDDEPDDEDDADDDDDDDEDDDNDDDDRDLRFCFLPCSFADEKGTGDADDRFLLCSGCRCGETDFSGEDRLRAGGGDGRVEPRSDERVRLRETTRRGGLAGPVAPAWPDPMLEREELLPPRSSTLTNPPANTRGRDGPG